MTDERVLLLGAGGQLATDIARSWRAAGVDLVEARHADLDLADAGALAALVERTKPAVVVNCAAMTNVPRCEAEPALAFAVNAIGAWAAARAAAGLGARFVQISTDYVFDGAKAAPYLEGDARRALNVYGVSKLAGEDLVRVAAPDALIVRVSGLFGVAGAAGKGGNFVETMLRLAGEGQPLRVVADQVTSPTNTADIADALLPLVREGWIGEVHLAAAGAGCSWFTFATAIFELCGLSPELTPVTAAAFGGPVQRPANSVLASQRGVALPHWRDGLERYLAAKGRRS